jgi:hypothetical protein
MADQQQVIFDAINAASKKGRGGLGYDGPKKRAKVVEETDGVEETVKAVVTAGDATDDADYGFADGGFDEAPPGTSHVGSSTSMDSFSRGGPSHNSRMHPRNEYRNRRPDFAALAARHASFAPLYALQILCGHLVFALNHVDTAVVSVKTGKGGEPCIDWKDAYAVRCAAALPLNFLADHLGFHRVLCRPCSELTTVLLKDDFGLRWELPINHLCPPVREFCPNDYFSPPKFRILLY